MKTTKRDSRAEAGTHDDKTSKPKAPSFSVDRKGEASAGALASKDKKRAVTAGRDGSNTR